MTGLWAMWWRMWRSARNTIVHYVSEQPLRGMCVAVVIALVWMLLTGVFYGVLSFLGQDQYVAIKPRLVESLLAVFFFALFFLVTLSDAMVVWSGLFRTRSALFHAQLPLSDRSLYWCAAVEGGLWASWAVIVLSLPLVGALAMDAASPAAYIPAGGLVLAAFIACCVAAGGLGSLLLARLIPLLRRGLKGFLLLAGVTVLGATVLALGNLDPERHPATFASDVIGRLRFAENPYLPPGWAQQALIAALQARWSDWFYFTALLVSTTVGLGVIGEALAGRRLRADLDALSGRPERRRGRAASRPWRPLPGLPVDIALLAAKDLRVFRRDPAQVLQFTMFFGLLAFYLTMLPRIGRAFLLDERWRPAVSLLNLTAIAMALATFTGRFVYPLLSLEGRRLWILILAPWPRHRVVTAKFVFALMVGLPVSLGMVLLSGSMLDLPRLVVGYQALVVVCLGMGLAAGALGIGARLADYTEDNPAKLVAGYGGNINLLASLVFCAVMLLGAGLPIMAGGEPRHWVLGVCWTLAFATAWTTFALRLAWRWFACF